ncbi:MAG: hypothetical protein U0T81_01570 [Saprospiraceae bacterium]
MNAEVTQLNGATHLESVVISVEGGQPQTLDAKFYTAFGLTPKLGPITGLQDLDWIRMPFKSIHWTIPRTYQEFLPSGISIRILVN